MEVSFKNVDEHIPFYQKLRHMTISDFKIHLLKCFDLKMANHFLSKIYVDDEFVVSFFRSSFDNHRQSQFYKYLTKKPMHQMVVNVGWFFLTIRNDFSHYISTPDKYKFPKELPRDLNNIVYEYIPTHYIDFYIALGDEDKCALLEMYNQSVKNILH